MSRRQPEKCGSLFTGGNAAPVERLGDAQEPENVVSVAQRWRLPQGVAQVSGTHAGFGVRDSSCRCIC